MTRKPKPEKPAAEMSEAERIEAWRRKRDKQGGLEKPKGRKGKSDDK